MWPHWEKLSRDRSQTLAPNQPPPIFWELNRSVNLRFYPGLQNQNPVNKAPKSVLTSLPMNSNICSNLQTTELEKGKQKSTVCKASPLVMGSWGGMCLRTVVLKLGCTLAHLSHFPELGRLLPPGPGGVLGEAIFRWFDLQKLVVWGSLSTAHYHQRQAGCPEIIRVTE